MTEKYQPHLHDNAIPGQDDDGEGARVAKMLARAGVASRRAVERLIEDGRVALNGEVLTTPAVKVRPGDILTVDGKMIDEPEATRVFRYHKPSGLMTTHNDPKQRPTVFQALPRDLPRLISVGRLDLNSEGLLLLTNDGALSRALEMPQNAWVRRYRARAFGDTTQAKLDKLKDGCTVEGVRYGPIEARLDKAQEKAGGGKNIWITLSLSEGKNREVRRVLESIGLKVNRLIRLSYGPFALGTLLPGQVEEVGPRVIRELLEGIVAEENMPKGDKPQFIGVADPLKAVGTAGGGDMQRRGVPRTNKAVQTSILIPDEKVEEEKFVRKPGWAKPKKKPSIVGREPVRPAKKSIESKMIGPKPLSYRDAAAKRIRDKEMADKNAADKRAAQGKDARPSKGSDKPKLGALRANGYKPLGDGPAQKDGRTGGKPSTVKAAGPKTAGSKPGEAGKVWSKPGMAKSAGARPDGPKGAPRADAHRGAPRADAHGGAPRPGGKPSGPRPGGSGAPPRGKR
ncbi:RNA-binding protein [Caulobacter sp. Root487D2Y]|uniref:pseudouridine synthase n=1 Tax=Caulobacter sp. Root487D2Y TaxID=1736547 RepID=UPI0006FD0CC2|nr:pseudouridine synthase [Caulobacter sp. Root487D2Y]KQY35379.1 RNA-binding protein [Caulobacter sp. Root487D2Y]